LLNVTELLALAIAFVSKVGAWPKLVLTKAVG
jgi:hypothetical protein